MRTYDYPTTNQERELNCIRHITDAVVTPANFRLTAFHPGLVFNGGRTCQADVDGAKRDDVTLATSNATEHAEAVAFLKANGYVVWSDNGKEITYS